MSVPILYEWTGDFMTPLNRFRAVCDKQFVVSEVYKLDIVEDRSLVTHNHFFAVLSEAWKQLPEEIAPRYPTMDRLRRRALIKCGFADERTFVFDTPADAVKLSGIVQTYDEDAVVLVKGRTVHVFTAKSQSMRAMGKEEFQRSKQAVLDEVSKLIGVDTTTLIAQTPRPRELEDDPA
jgi:hypothetical protein